MFESPRRESFFIRLVEEQEINKAELTCAMCRPLPKHVAKGMAKHAVRNGARTNSWLCRHGLCVGLSCPALLL